MGLMWFFRIVWTSLVPGEWLSVDVEGRFDEEGEAV